jgi:hypothetical protein
MAKTKAGVKPQFKPSQKASAPQVQKKERQSQVEPALFLSPAYAAFKYSARTLAEDLKPLGLSISMLERGLANYVAKKFTFKVNGTILAQLREYQGRKATWESFRDSFRATEDAATIPSGALEELLNGDYAVEIHDPEEEEEEKN